MSHPITWETSAGSIGTFAAEEAMTYKIQAVAADPYVITEYVIISGNLPEGLSFRSDGLISGTPDTVSADTTTTFVVRVYGSDGVNTIFQDRTFEITISGEASPTFITTSGDLLVTNDSVWVEKVIEYNNPISTNPVIIRLFTGSLPPGLEINEFGVIRGYPSPPVITESLTQVSTSATATNGSTNLITVLSTTNFSVDRPIIFTGTMISPTITAGKIYYIKEIISNSIKITEIPGGDAVSLDTNAGFMSVNLPATSVNQPTKIKYTFTLQLTSPKGTDTATYSISVINQNLPVSQGGPGLPPGLRVPVLLNTQPSTFNIKSDSTNYGYYVLPPAGSVTPEGVTYKPSQSAFIGQFQSGDFFSFHALGKDYDGRDITYIINNLPVWANYDTITGWITGTPVITPGTISEYDFTITVTKDVIVGGTTYTISTLPFNFSLRIANAITGDINWITDSNLGTFYNASVSYKNIVAESDVELEYYIKPGSGSLPPNLSLKLNGELVGTIVYQPGTNFVDSNVSETFTFTVVARATDPTLSALLYSEKTFSMTVVQEFTQPTDILYIKCTPDAEDRNIIASLLNDANIIPSSYLYRTNDQNFGKATDVSYGHAYGIYASNLDEYIAAVEKNHYWRDITLGQIKTAIARDENNQDIVYEVVYSTVIDNLQHYDTLILYDPLLERYVKTQPFDYRYSESVAQMISWPRYIDLNLGPWYTSSTEIYTSFIFNQDAILITNLREYDLLTQSGIPILINGGIPTFYTSLSPGYAIELYPNSLENMRSRVQQELGFDNNFRLLPLWMTSQQLDGNTLGFTPAWVIAYTKPAEPIITTATATFAPTNTITVGSTEGFIVGRPVVFSGNPFGNLNVNQKYYIKEIVSGNQIKISETVSFNSLGNPVPGPVCPVTTDDDTYTGPMTVTFDPVSYAGIIKENIETNWAYTLNQVDFQIDRFSVDKVLTYDWDNYIQTPVWTEYPTTTPTPVPEDSKNFYVIFPRKTILPTETQ